MAITKKPLQPSSGLNANPPAEAAPVDGLKQDGARPGKTIEEMYQKKTQLEHILLRPDTYIGSIEKHSQQLWVYEDNQMVNRMVSYVPGLYKIFDEILVNAADNKQRDPSMDSVKVDIDVEQNTISVFNNGDGVPVEVHQEEGVYVPEMIFGHLLTSSNYDDNVKKTTGGRNGYGAKLTNIFSTEFIIQTADGKRQKKYKQVFSNNMSIKSDPSISKCKDAENWTKVTFKPDLAKFNMTHLEDDVVALMKKRVVDLAGCLGKTIKVELNGKRVPVKSFGDYVSLYLQSASKSRSDPLPRITEKVNDRWEICVSLSEGQFQQVSFVNSIATIKGGTHVEYVTSQVTNHIMNIVNKKNKNAAMKAHSVKNHLWVFVNALIDNPAFDSQTKETLTTRQGSFGSKCELSQEFLKKVAKSGVVESLLSWADFKQSKDLKKTDGSKRQRLTGITKLEDANDAGGKYSEECTLILTEGDSAKALAMAGISVVGRNHYGVFPLRGKLLNVREASHKQIMENAEIQNIKRILGLQHGKEYDSVKSLRYGHLMIMTDQDHDGSHIKGLLINFIHSFWPSLLKIPSFLVEFITPIVKATHKNGTVLSFYSMPEYETWREQVGRTTKSWSIKYYKGLGTSTSKEGKEYFSNLGRHKKEFRWVDDHDGDAIELAFSKKKIEERKTWLKQYQQGTYLDQSQKLINYKDFVNKELILFSRADLERSIPSMLDGLKPGQRKILFCCFKRNLTSDVKVAQFSGYVSEHSAYHHGEQSLASTIIGMAQNYVGSNNINLLFPAGQFGTRNQGGKDHASARYIYTRMSPLTRFLFPKDEDILLDYMEEDGLSIEPQWYMPIIPTVLVNGSEGIGTGWSSFIPNYNPRDIVDNVKRLLRGENMEPMEPWYKGFEGLIEKSSTKESGATYTVSGVIEQINETMLRITELPIRKWTQDYKEFLESMMSGNEKIKEPFIKDYREHNTDTKVHFEVFLTEENMKAALQEGLLKKFKLTSSISISNMHLFDANCNIKRYDCPEQVLEEFVPIRLSFYEKRKRVLLDNLTEELLKLADKVRFILGVVGGEIVVSNRKRAELLDELHRKGFRKFSKQSKGSGAAAAVSNQDDAESPESPQSGGYEYLLSMPIGSLTLEKVQELCSQRDKLHNDVEELKKSTPESLWLNDLDTFLVQFDELERLEAKDEENQLNNIAGNAAKRTSRQVAKNPRKNNAKKPSSATITEQMEVEPATSTSIPTEVVKEPSKPGKRAPAKRNSEKDVGSDDEDEELLELKDRLAKYNFNYSPSDQSAMDTEVVVAPPRKETSSRRVAQKPDPLYSEISDDEGNDHQLKPVAEEDGGGAAQKKQPLPRKPRGKKQAVDSTDDEEYTEADDGDSGSDFEVRAATKVVTTKKGRGKAAKSTVIDNVGGNKKRGDNKTKPALGQKLINELLKPVEKTGISPDQKVRKMRPSPFNKKSGVSRSSTETSLDSSSSVSKSQSPDSDEEEVAVVVEVPMREKRPQRNRTVAKYVISDSDSDEA